MFLHRLPHMKLNKQTKMTINVCLYLLIIVLTILYNFSTIPFDVVSNGLASFDQMIIPGALFYFKYKQKWLRDDIDISMYLIMKRKSINVKNKFWSCCSLFKRKKRETLIDQHFEIDQAQELYRFTAESSIRPMEIT